MNDYPEEILFGLKELLRLESPLARGLFVYDKDIFVEYDSTNKKINNNFKKVLERLCEYFKEIYQEPEENFINHRQGRGSIIINGTWIHFVREYPYKNIEELKSFRVPYAGLNNGRNWDERWKFMTHEIIDSWMERKFGRPIKFKPIQERRIPENEFGEHSKYLEGWEDEIE